MSVSHITVLCVQPTMMVPQHYVVVGMGVDVMVSSHINGSSSSRFYVCLLLNTFSLLTQELLQKRRYIAGV